jgi:hypothetical protein
MCDNDAGDIHGQYDAFGRIALVYARQAKMTTCVRAFEDQQRLAVRMPEQAVYHECCSLLRMGFECRRHGMHTDAVVAFNRALATLQHAAQPNNVRYNRLRVALLWQLHIASRQIGNVESALTALCTCRAHMLDTDALDDDASWGDVHAYSVTYAQLLATLCTLLISVTAVGNAAQMLAADEQLLKSRKVVLGAAMLVRVHIALHCLRGEYACAYDKCHQLLTNAEKCVCRSWRSTSCKNVLGILNYSRTALGYWATYVCWRKTYNALAKCSNNSCTCHPNRQHSSTAPTWP